MKKKIAIAMSGGVDSSVAAALLKEKGYEVIGITMCLGVPDAPGKKASCCGAQGIADAKRVADILGIKHYVLDFGSYMRDKVINDFLDQYAKGLTPNPCVRCNEHIKFSALFEKVCALGMDCLATGHYARVEKKAGRYYLKKAVDKKKDQSYFLYRIPPSRLGKIIFPLGALTKEKVRGLAVKYALPVAQKKESQEICFVRGDYRDFLRERGIGAKPGNFLDLQGNELGRHKGIAFYTIGQREGLGIAAGYPIYVHNINRQDNSIALARKEDMYSSRFTLRDVVGCPAEVSRLTVKIRYLSPGIPARVRKSKNGIEVLLAEPAFAITPGQSAVFYSGARVTGGGIIQEVFK